MAEDFNPFEAGQGQNAWPLLERMRAESPVVEIANGMQYVTRLDDCRGVLRDPRSFSNATGMKAPGVEVPFEDRLLGELDPPRHTLVRRVVVTALSPKLVHATAPFMRETADALLGAMSGTADLVPAFTVPLPNRVTVRMIGLDPADADQLQAWAKGLMESTFPAMNRTDRGEGFAGAFPEFAGYIDDHIEARAAQIADGSAPDDVLTRLMQITDDGEQLPRRQIRALVRNLITGGFTTTSQLVGNLLHQILTDPEVERAIRDSDDALHRATEESLRLSPPILFMARGCVQDVEIAGCPVSAGHARDHRLRVGQPRRAHLRRPRRVPRRSSQLRRNTSRSDSVRTCAPARPSPAPSPTPASAPSSTTSPKASVRLAPDFEFENVPTYFEIGPKRLPIIIEPA